MVILLPFEFVQKISKFKPT